MRGASGFGLSTSLCLGVDRSFGCRLWCVGISFRARGVWLVGPRAVYSSAGLNRGSCDLDSVSGRGNDEVQAAEGRRSICGLFWGFVYFRAVALGLGSWGGAESMVLYPKPKPSKVAFYLTRPEIKGDTAHLTATWCVIVLWESSTFLVIQPSLIQLDLPIPSFSTGKCACEASFGRSKFRKKC